MSKNWRIEGRLFPDPSSRAEELERSKHTQGFSGGSDGKESTSYVGDLSSIPGLGRSPGGENGNPLQYSCLENPMDRGARRLQSVESQRVGHN